MSARLLEVWRPWTGTRLGARVFLLCFGIPTVLIAVYASLVANETNTWRIAAICWVLALLVIRLIAGIASMIERCEREANPNGGPAVIPATQWRHAAPLREPIGTDERVVQLEQVIVRQHRFVGDAAHELRTPLTAQCLVGESVLARQAATSSELREAIASMLEESKHMKRLVEGLLDLTRASLATAAKQRSSHQQAALDLSVLARDCVESLRVLAEEKLQSIHMDASAGVLVDADITMVRQALLNVIHNSIEHCPEGTHIRIALERRLPDEALIQVQDNGPGIPPEEQCSVFERFYRGAGSSRRGLGLGLAIAKAILRSQGGDIELRSAVSAGCCFLLTLPLIPGGKA